MVKKTHKTPELSEKERVLEIHKDASCVKDDTKFCIVSKKDSKEKFKFRISPFCISDDDAWKMALHWAL